MKTKHAAMEMSMGTLVTIVLLVAVLILGLVFIDDIFGTGKSALDMTEQQLNGEIQKLFSKDESVVIYPTSGLLEIKHEERDAIGIGIKNLARTGSGTNSFSYTVRSVSSNCPQSVDPDSWIVIGESEEDIPILVGELYATKVVFEIPLGTPLCTARYRADVTIDGSGYKSRSFDVAVKG